MKSLAGTWNSYLAVQNAAGDSVDVTVTYKDKDGNDIPAATENATIPANSNKVFYQAGNAGLPAGFLGAATVSADDGTSNLAVVANFYNSGTSSGTAQFHSYNGFVSGANKLLIPRIVRNFYGYNGGLTIQNIGPDNVQVKVTFNFAGTDYVHDSGAIAPGAALALYMPNVPELAPVDALATSERNGSAIVEVTSGTGPIVAIVNEDNRGGPVVAVERAGQGSTYNGVVDGTQSQSLFFPQVPKHAGVVWSGGFQIANTTATATTCDISYVGAPGADQTGVVLVANGTISTFAPNVAGLPNGFNAGVTAVCGEDVVGISNLAVNAGSGKFGDSLSTANGLNQ
jgi:hypothetical protein